MLIVCIIVGKEVYYEQKKTDFELDDDDFTYRSICIGDFGETIPKYVDGNRPCSIRCSAFCKCYDTYRGAYKSSKILKKKKRAAT